VPEIETSTMLHTERFFARARQRFSLLKKLAMWLARHEIEDDARFVPMRLDRYDAPLAHNHRLLSRIYQGRDLDRSSPEPEPEKVREREISHENPGKWVVRKLLLPSPTRTNEHPKTLPQRSRAKAR
jgi:hypothetical protein